ncbi:DUF3800 domain-containing protein [Hyphomonas sp.]|uniref:DUF3800 domain-containing protein n=1 Tax=Alphaproteobacteria TaxID=28211 RepID=UPI003263C476
MRLTYIDEGGTSDREPFMVVAGVMVDADYDLVNIEAWFDALVATHIPEPDREGFIFHATDIWSGGGYFKSKEDWPLDRRLEILDELVATPAMFQVPVGYGAIRKESWNFGQLFPHFTNKQRGALLHASAYGRCCQMVEGYMRRRAENEITLLIAEDRDHVRETVKGLHALLQHPDAREILNAPEAHFVPFVHIRDTVHFAKKAESRLLQLADICTFVIRGHLSGHPQNPRLYDVLEPCLIWKDNGVGT